MSKIIDYNAAIGFDSGDVLLKDGTNGTKKITVENAAKAFAGLIDPMDRRNHFEYKNLGTAVTNAQKTAIQDGTFEGLMVGNYWEINSIKWLIADMDYWHQCGDTAFTKHHLVIVPEKTLYNHPMNDTNITEGGYVGSKMYTEGLDQAKATIQAAFGDLVLTHKEYLCNAVTDGHPSGAAWFESTVELMNEPMVYGSYIHTPGGTGIMIPTRHTIDKTQLALFRLNPKMINTRQYYWLRDVVSATSFAFVYYGGGAYYIYASYTYLGVRPAFAIGV